MNQIPSYIYYEKKNNQKLSFANAVCPYAKLRFHNKAFYIANHFYHPWIWTRHTQTVLVSFNPGVVYTLVELATSGGLVGFGFFFVVDVVEGIVFVFFSDAVDTRFGMEDFALDAWIVADFVVIMGIFPVVEAVPRINLNHD